jgi:hypothetical protein
MRKDEEIMELSHEPVPGYRGVFYIVLAVAAGYLAAILAYTL